VSRQLSFFEPPNLPYGLEPPFVHSCLAVCGHEVSLAAVGSWTELERILAYDYTIRVHMHVDARAQNISTPVELRPCPSFVIAADEHRGARSLWVQLRLSEEVA
jgi:hypothetical protein